MDQMNGIVQNVVRGVIVRMMIQNAPDAIQKYQMYQSSLVQNGSVVVNVMVHILKRVRNFAITKSQNMNIGHSSLSIDI